MNLHYKQHVVRKLTRYRCRYSWFVYKIKLQDFTYVLYISFEKSFQLLGVAVINIFSFILIIFSLAICVEHISYLT